jgi:hypothetical protein
MRYSVVLKPPMVKSFADLLQTVKPNISHDLRIATLPIIRYEVIEGGEKGQTVALATKLAINKFFSLGVPNIQNECNSVARRYRALWKTKPSEQKMSEYQLPDLTYAQGISEVLPDFVLFEPSSIRVKIFNRYCPSNPSIAATVLHSKDNLMNPMLIIYLDILEVRNSTIYWTGFSTSFEYIIYHELLHACGDSPELRNEIRDGFIRQTMVCSEAICNLCK